MQKITEYTGEPNLGSFREWWLRTNNLAQDTEQHIGLKLDLWTCLMEQLESETMPGWTPEGKTFDGIYIHLIK